MSDANQNLQGECSRSKLQVCWLLRWIKLITKKTEVLSAAGCTCNFWLSRNNQKKSIKISRNKQTRIRGCSAVDLPPAQDGGGVAGGLGQDQVDHAHSWYFEDDRLQGHPGQPVVGAEVDLDATNGRQTDRLAIRHGQLGGYVRCTTRLVEFRQRQTDCELDHPAARYIIKTMNDKFRKNIKI